MSRGKDPIWGEFGAISRGFRIPQGGGIRRASGVGEGLRGVGFLPSVLAHRGGGWLYEQYGRYAPFVFGSGVMALALLIAALFY